MDSAPDDQRLQHAVALGTDTRYHELWSSHTGIQTDDPRLGDASLRGHMPVTIAKRPLLQNEPWTLSILGSEESSPQARGLQSPNPVPMESCYRRLGSTLGFTRRRSNSWRLTVGMIDPSFLPMDEPIDTPEDPLGRPLVNTSAHLTITDRFDNALGR